MKKNETNWRKWYLTTVGKQWSEEDGASLEGLSPEQKAVGELLYNRYVQEKKAGEDKAFDAMQRDVSVRKSLLDLSQSKNRLDRYTQETALSRGLQGSGKAAQSVQSQEAAYRQAVDDVWQKSAETKRKAAAEYLEQERAKDEVLAQNLDKTQQQFERSNRQSWQQLHTKLTKRLSSIQSPYDQTAYTQEGVEALRKQVEQNKEELGRYYQEAREWVDALPVFNQDNSKVMVPSQSGRYYAVDQKDYQLADVVQYAGGAGAKLNGLDILSITYRGEKYYARPKEEVGQDKSRFLSALAQDKGVSLGVGTVLYNQGVLYVYDGKGEWRSTQNAVSIGRTNLDSLLKLIEQMQG